MEVISDRNRRLVTLDADETVCLMALHGANLMECPYLVEELFLGNEVSFRGSEGRVFMAPVKVHDVSVVVDVTVV